MVSTWVAVGAGIGGLFAGAIIGVMMLALCVVSGGHEDEITGYSSFEDKPGDIDEGDINR